MCGARRYQGLYPVSTLPALPTWARHRVIIIGDAAHTLLPNSGQGACQALEDAEALAHLVGHYASVVSESVDTTNEIGLYDAIDVAAKKFFQMRAPRVRMVVAASRLVRPEQETRDTPRVGAVLCHLGPW
jgi:2-polyprenyl-6-methoxyphenol hydroxylase-like FAD-dependent oxidoreductase